MAFFYQGDKPCYFIHVPRTGGRYVSSLFENTDGVECHHHQIGVEQLNNVDITHLSWPDFEQINSSIKESPHITVVRNPYDKIFSSIQNMYRVHGVDYDSLLKDEFECYKLLFEEIISRSKHNNWFLPQYKFMSPKTHVWKYESGFGEDFRTWVQEKTGIELNDLEVDYEKISGEGEDEGEPLVLSDESRKNIENFYHKDYETFDYRRQ